MIRANRRSYIQDEPYEQQSKPAHFGYIVDVKYESIEERLARLRKDQHQVNIIPSKTNPIHYQPQNPNSADLKRSGLRSHSSDLIAPVPKPPSNQMIQKSRPNLELLNQKKSNQPLRKWKYDNLSSNQTPSQAMREILKNAEYKASAAYKSSDGLNYKGNESIEESSKRSKMNESYSSGFQIEGRTRITAYGYQKSNSGKGNQKQEFNSYEANTNNSQDRQIGINKIRKLPIHLLANRS